MPFLRGGHADRVYYDRHTDHHHQAAGKNARRSGKRAHAWQFAPGSWNLRREGFEVKNSDFFKIGIPFTLAAIIPAYIYIWLVYGV
jgi:hypothetical protein